MRVNSERIHGAMAQIREEYSRRFISLTAIDMMALGSRDHSRRSSSSAMPNCSKPISPLSRLGSSHFLQVPSSQPSLRTPVTTSSNSEALGGFSRQSAVPQALNVTPKPSVEYLSSRRLEASPPKGTVQFTLDSITQYPEPAVLRPQQRESSRVSRGQSFIAHEMARMSMTPSDLIYPPGALVNDALYRQRLLAQTFGLPQSRWSHDTESMNVAYEILDIPPDGGRLAWAHAWAGFLVTFNCWGLNIAYGAFQAYYAFDMLPGVALAKLSWIGSIQLFLIFFLGTPIGLAMDRGWFRVFFNGGSILLVASIFTMSFCTEWWQLFLVQGLISGLAMGMVFSSGTIILMSYFKNNIGVATGIAAAGSPVGAIVYSAAFRYAILPLGFAWTVRIIASIALATMVIANAIVRPRLDRRNQTRTINWQVFRDLPYWTMTIGFFFTFWGLFFGFYYIVSFGIEILYMTGVDAITLLIAMSAANLPGRFIPGLISDRCIGPLNTLVPSCMLSAMMIFLWIGSTTRSSLLVVACFYGFASAGVQALYASTIHSFSYSTPESMGQKSGMVFTIISFACLTGTPIGGALISANHGEYLYAQLFTGACLVLGGLLLLLARFLKVGWGAQRA